MSDPVNLESGTPTIIEIGVGVYPSINTQYLQESGARYIGFEIKGLDRPEGHEDKVSLLYGSAERYIGQDLDETRWNVGKESPILLSYGDGRQLPLPNDSVDEVIFKNVLGDPFLDGLKWHGDIVFEEGQENSEAISILAKLARLFLLPKDSGRRIETAVPYKNFRMKIDMLKEAERVLRGLGQITVLEDLTPGVTGDFLRSDQFASLELAPLYVHGARRNELPLMPGILDEDNEDNWQAYYNYSGDNKYNIRSVSSVHFLLLPKQETTSPSSQ